MMKERTITKGYVRSDYVAGIWCLVLICLGGQGALLLYLLHKLQHLEAYVWTPMVVWSVLSLLLLLIILIFDKSAARYCITQNAVYSRNLLSKHCTLEDGQVKQIELVLLVASPRYYSFNKKLPYLVCSDSFYKHDDRIALSYHRKSQVVVRITRKNLPYVQEYLQRMGIDPRANRYEALVQMLECRHELYRQENGEWKRHYDN